MSAFKVKGRIWIENSKGQVIGPGRNELLEAIRDNGSIKLAANAMKMSYRHAWEMVNEINTVSDKPIIIKNAGGASGGGTILTKEGEALIASYKKLSAAFEKFKSQMNQIL